MELSGEHQIRPRPSAAVINNCSPAVIAKIRRWRSQIKSGEAFSPIPSDIGAVLDKRGTLFKCYI